MGIFLPHYTCRHMHTRSSPSVTERGRVTVPCKDWPSATASGGCGLDKGLPPGPRLPPRDRRWSPAGDEHRGRSNDRAGRTAIAISNRWFSVNFSLALTRRTDYDARATTHEKSPPIGSGSALQMSRLSTRKVEAVEILAFIKSRSRTKRAFPSSSICAGLNVRANGS